MIDGTLYNLNEIDNNAKIDGGIDDEIRKLIPLINQVDGIETIQSCFGHHKEPCRIYFRARDIESLNKFKYNFFYCDSLWAIELIVTDVTIDDGKWNTVEAVVVSRYKDYPTIDLMVDNLVYRFNSILAKQI